MEPFKNMFNRAYFERFVKVAKRYIPNFKEELFISDIFDKDWEHKELKERARHTTLILGKHMTAGYAKNVEAIVNMIRYIQESTDIKPGIEAMFFPDFIEYYGLDHYDISMHAMEEITQYFSCEFSVRPFIIKYPEKAMEQMYQWSNHTHYGVRRLASEGSRPRLPWGMAIPFLKKDPEPLIRILENLKDDEAETVRKSVANNLNDISKDNPEVVIGLVKKWKGHSKNRDWLVKHASRTLLKQAQPEILEIFGYGSVDKIDISDFRVETPKVEMEKDLIFSFRLSHRCDTEVLIRLEYGMYYQKANGTLSKKVFKISEKVYQPGENKGIKRKQSFRKITTRKYHTGLHKVSLIVNGSESELLEFELI